MECTAINEQLKKYSRLTLSCHNSNIHCLRWNSEGNLLASGGKDKIMQIHRVTDSELKSDKRYPKDPHTNEIEQLSWNPDNPNMLATASVDKSIKIWDLRYTEPVNSIRLKNENMCVNWSNNGSSIAVADKADVLSILDPRKAFEVIEDQKCTFEVCEIAWNKEGDLLFVTSVDGNIHVIGYPGGQTYTIIDAHASPCVCIRFDRIGKNFAVGSNDAITSVWDSENLICFQAIDNSERPIKAISFSYDNRYIASGSEDKEIDISDIYTGERVTSIDVNAPIPTLDFHPKEYILAYVQDERAHDYRDLGTIKVVGFPEDRPSYN